MCDLGVSGDSASVFSEAGSVMKFSEMLAALEAAQNDHEQLALATIDIVLSGRDPQVRAALEAASVPHWFDSDVLAALLGLSPQGAATTVVALRVLPMVEALDNRQSWAIDQDARRALRLRLAEEDPDRFRILSQRCAQWLAGDEPVLRIESLYHRLTVTPDEAAEQLRILHEEWQRQGRTELLGALGVPLHELVRTPHLASSARARALVCLGWIYEARLSLRDREKYARDALQLFQQLGAHAGQAEAHAQLGRVAQTAGKLPEALAEYMAGREVLEHLVVTEPQNTDYRHELAVVHHDLADVYQSQGDFAEALNEYHAGRSVMLQLIEYDPRNTDWRRDLSASHNRVGSLLQAQGRNEEALDEYHAYNEIMRRLVEADPSNTDWQRELAVSYNCVGTVLQLQRKLDEALREYRAHHAIMERLVEIDPNNTDWQRELSVSHLALGRVLEQQGKFDETLGHYRAYRCVSARLVRLDPENVGWQRDLIVANHRVGRVLVALDYHEQAKGELEAGLVRAQGLVSIDPSNVQWRRDVEAIEQTLGELAEVMGGAVATGA